MTEEFDLLIVGSGAAGSTFARIVNEMAPRATILMIDRGRYLTDRAGSNLKNSMGPASMVIHPEDRQTVSSGAPRPPSAQAIARGTASLARPGTHLIEPAAAALPAGAMSSNVGGMMAHWTCATPRPDVAERVTMFTSTEHDRLLSRAEQLLSVNTDAFASSVFSRRLVEALGGVFDHRLGTDRPVQLMPLACEVDGAAIRWSGADTILGPLADASTRPGNVNLRAETMCTRVVVEGGTVRGAELIDLGSGAKSFVAARRVVIAADSLRTPQLLWSSGVRRDALGRGFNDQPQVLCAVRVDDGFFPDDGDQADRADRPPRTPRGVVWVPYSQPGHPYHGQVMHFDLSSVHPSGVSGSSSHVVALSWYCAKDVSPDDRVHFDASQPDEYEMPAIGVEYSLTEQDVANLAGAKECQLAAANAIGEIIGDPDPEVLPAGTSLHYQGTVRMGSSDDGTSVCDSYSRVWGIDGLYVGGNGVIPTATACNPTLTSVALAVRAGERLASGLD